MPNSEASAMLPMLGQQQRQLDNIEKQITRLTEVMTRMAVLEEKRNQDSKAMEKLEQRQVDLEDKFEKFENEQVNKNSQYNEMLGNYNKFKNAVVTFIIGGAMVAILAGASGKVHFG